MRNLYRLLLTGLSIVLALAAVYIFLAFSKPASASLDPSNRASQAAREFTLPMTAVLSDPITPTSQVFLPRLFGGGTPAAELVDHGFNDQLGIDKFAFLPGTPFTYYTLLHNHYPYSITAALQVNQTSLCGDSQVFSGTLVLPPGLSAHRRGGEALDCTGVYNSTARLTYSARTDSFTAQYVVTQPGGILFSNQQGFDRCWPPDLDEMETWWRASPYWVFNIYLGGESFFCDDAPMDAAYVYRLAEQGWSFILTWVGPQAPCSNFLHKMSSNANTARNQGRAEAGLAVARAEELGFLGDKIIYYDMEAYSSTAPQWCRDTVSAFMEGWVERLHELDVKGGGYGAGCTSYVADWAANDPAPDDAWLAHWLLPAQYRPTVSLYNIACVDPSLWVNRRLRQYAGGHAETWGGETLIIDSNLLDGEVTAIPTGDPNGPESTAGVQTQVYGPPMSALGMSSSTSGWVISDGRLLVSRDGGETWQNLTPDSLEFLAADFQDPQNGWAVARQADRASLSLAQTRDGGATWGFSPLPDSEAASLGIAGASIAVESASRVQIALQRPTSSALKIFEHLTTPDAGENWQSRTIELSAAQPDPPGLEIFASEDFLAPALAPAPAPAPAASPETLPGVIAQDFFDSQNGWAILQRGECRGEKGSATTEPGAAPLVCTQEWMLLSTGDGGQTWREITPYDHLPTR